MRPCFQKDSFKPDSGMGKTIAVDVTLRSGDGRVKAVQNFSSAIYSKGSDVSTFGQSNVPIDQRESSLPGFDGMRS